MFDSKDVAEYYNTTQNHYESWWNLKEGLSLHYGIWGKETKTFTQSLVNTNKVLLETAGIEDGMNILDAGCGVGGAARFMAEQRDVKVIGITLSEKQVEYATQMAKEQNLSDRIQFKEMDYTQTHFEDESFDVVWACESVSSAPDQLAFIREAYRILKKGGKLVVSDYYLTSKNQKDHKNWIKKWIATWGLSALVTIDDFREGLDKCGFSNIATTDYSAEVTKSAKRMYYAAILGFLPSETYNLFHPNVSRFAKHHYRSGYYQYKTLKKNLWKYFVVYAEKGG